MWLGSLQSEHNQLGIQAEVALYIQNSHNGPSLLPAQLQMQRTKQGES